LLEALCSGSGARLALGTSVITYLIAYNEAAAPGLLFGTLLATIYGAMAGRCNSLKNGNIFKHGSQKGFKLI